MAQQDQDTLLKIDGVSLSYDGRPILRDVHAEIARTGHGTGQAGGHIVGFLGPSGVGKTQLFRIIAGLHQPDMGAVLIAGDSGLLPVRAGEVGVVAQNYPLFAHRTILGNLLLSLRKFSVRQMAMDVVLGKLEQFNLTQQANLYPAQLSGGQRQRVAILQMILSGSRFILMDEPFSGLDMLMLEKTCQTIFDMADHGENRTIIIVTHDITSAASICDHLWLLGAEYDTNGQKIPGSRIVQIYDLLARGLGYEPGIITTAPFTDFVREVKDRFRRL